MKLVPLNGGHRWLFHVTDSIRLKFEVGRVRGLYWARAAYGGQDHFGQISAGWGWGFWLGLETPYRWHRIRPRDGKYGDSRSEFGFAFSHGSLRLAFGRDPMGTHYGGGRGRFRGALRSTWKNRELSLWDNRWLVGRQRSHWVDVAEIPYVLEIGQWQGDTYAGTMRLRRLEWRQRFRSGHRWDWDFEMPSPGRGIPVPGNPDSDYYDGDDGIFAFGVSADQYSLAEAAAQLRSRVIQERGTWRPATAAVSL